MYNTNKRGQIQRNLNKLVAQNYFRKKQRKYELIFTDKAATNRSNHKFKLRSKDAYFLQGGIGITAKCY